MKTILLHVHNDDGQPTRLAAAIALARAFDGRIQCVQVSPLSSYVVTEPFGGMYMVGQLYEEMERQARESKAAIDVALTEANVAYDWIGFDGGVSQSLVIWSRLSDIIVLSQVGAHKEIKIPPIPIVGDVALHARTPVLVVPILPSRAFDRAGPFMVAWNGSPESANALRASLLLLSRASKVSLVTVDGDTGDFPVEKAIAYLALHGIEASEHAVRSDGGSVAAALIAAATSLRVSCVVMGAYGHSRFREAVLGGVTRSMLEESPVPLLLAH